MRSARPTVVAQPPPEAGIAAARRVPIRTCVGCRTRAPQVELVRLGVDADQQIVFDPRRRLPGRGAWLHPDEACWERARKRGVAAFRLSGVERRRIPDGPPLGQVIQAKVGTRS